MTIILCHPYFLDEAVSLLILEKVQIFQMKHFHLRQVYFTFVLLYHLSDSAYQVIAE